MISKEDARANLAEVERVVGINSLDHLEGLFVVRQYIQNLEDALSKELDSQRAYNLGWDSALQEMRAFCNRRGKG